LPITVCRRLSFRVPNWEDPDAIDCGRPLAQLPVDAVLAGEIEVVAVGVSSARDLDDLLLAEPFLQAPLRLWGGILDEHFPWSNFRGAGQGLPYSPALTINMREEFDQDIEALRMRMERFEGF
jgi:hypothetical protein